MPCCLVVTRYTYPSGRSVEVRHPAGCKPCPTTLYSVSKRSEPVYEERSRYCVVKKPRLAVFPREACRILDRVMEGELPRLILLGPPGTGKSMFMKILGDVAPARTVWWKVEENISKYIGETEKRFKSLLQEASVSRPTLLLFDEGDALVQPRGGGGGGDGGNVTAYDTVSANLVNIFLTWLQNLTDENVKDIGVVVSTNKDINQIDFAIRRAGRLTPLYFPPPDAEAVEILAELHGKKVDDPARIASIAASFANIVEYLRTGELKPYQPSPWVVFYSIDCSKLRPRGGFEVTRETRIVVSEPPPLGLALAAALSCLYNRRPLVVPAQPRYVEDARFTAESMDTLLGLPFFGYDRYGSVLMASANVPVAFIGPEWPDTLPRFDFNTIAGLVGGVNALAAALGVKTPGAATRAKIMSALGGVNVF